jgi:hypothetical protein
MVKEPNQPMTLEKVKTGRDRKEHQVTQHAVLGQKADSGY